MPVETVSLLEVQFQQVRCGEGSALPLRAHVAREGPDTFVVVVMFCPPQVHLQRLDGIAMEAANPTLAHRSRVVVIVVTRYVLPQSLQG